MAGFASICSVNLVVGNNERSRWKFVLDVYTYTSLVFNKVTQRKSIVHTIFKASGSGDVAAM